MTRDKLLIAARTLFLARGYFATGTDDILQAASVQRGSLYHHFKDKAALLEAVTRQLQGEALLALANACAEAADPLLTGCLAWLDWLSSPGHARLLLNELPAALPEPQLAELAESGMTGWLRSRLAHAPTDLGPDHAPVLAAMLGALACQSRPMREALLRDWFGRFARTPVAGRDYLRLLAAAREGQAPPAL
jgi:AcrR family transcriptional regulator